VRMRFVSQPMRPEGESFDTSRMGAGEPGLPARFRVGTTVYEVAEVLDRRREYGDCRHGSGERYLRRYVFRVRTTGGEILTIQFHRSFDRPRGRSAARWWLQWIEEPGDGH
jgi:hypothetical protein